MGIAAERPLYVLEINKDKNEVVLGFDDETMQDMLYCENMTWLSIEPVTEPRKVLARIRSSQVPTEAEIQPVANDKFVVKFENMQKAIAPGQSVVFYENDLLLGGGIIVK